MAALLLHRAFLWISTISSAFLNLQFCIMSLMALNHWKRRRQKNTAFTEAERNDEEVEGD